MKTIFLLSFIPALFLSCISIPENVKKDKEKFIEIGLEESEPIDMTNLDYIYRHALFSNRDRKLKYLNVDQIQTIREASPADQLNIDSIVIFNKDQYLILFDFSKSERTFDALRKLSKLKSFQQIDNRLYIGIK